MQRFKDILFVTDSDSETAIERTVALAKNNKIKSKLLFGTDRSLAMGS